MTISKIVATFAGFLVCTVVVASAVGQDSRGDQAKPEASHDFSVEKLNAFIAAATEVNEIMLAWRDRLKQAEDQEQRQQMMQEANEEFVKTVEETANITMAEYQEIANAANQDQMLADDLRQRVRAKIKDGQPEASADQ